MARLWLVDDDPTYLFLLKELLGPMGHELTLLSNGAELLTRLQAGQEPTPDLIMTDVMMPGCDGFTLQQKLREDDRANAIPIIVMTSKGNLRDSFSQEPGVVAFIEKPLDFDLLRAAVAKALARTGAV